MNSDLSPILTHLAKLSENLNRRSTDVKSARNSDNSQPIKITFLSLPDSTNVTKIAMLYLPEQPPREGRKLKEVVRHQIIDEQLSGCLASLPTQTNFTVDEQTIEIQAVKKFIGVNASTQCNETMAAVRVKDPKYLSDKLLARLIASENDAAKNPRNIPRCEVPDRRIAAARAAALVRSF